jgi:hypothetical protein
MSVQRSRWAAFGAAVAVTLGGGGVGLVGASVDSGDRAVTVTVSPQRIVDTRTGLGLSGVMVNAVPRDVQVTGTVEVASGGSKVVVPSDAVAVLVNVTVILPSSAGFLSLRPAGAVGVPSTSTVNFQPGTVEPNAATVDLAGGKVQVFVKTAASGGSAHVLVDVVGYTVGHTHDDRYYTESETDALIAAIPAGPEGPPGPQGDTGPTGPAGPQYGRTIAYSPRFDSVTGVGHDSSITIGVDGLPIISHQDFSNFDLRVTHCADLACTSATSTNVDTAGFVGSHSSITIGADGLPIISHYDSTNGDLRVTHCNDIACTSATSSTVDDASDLGKDSSITIGVDGLAIISHHDRTFNDLRVTHCSNVECTLATSRSVDTAGNVGSDSSITIGVDGFPIISHYDASNGDLRVTHCNDVVCTLGLSTATSTTVDTIGNVGEFLSMTIGVDGLPIISHHDASNLALRVTHCDNTACTSATSTNVDTTGNVGRHSSITIGADGLPIISHQDTTSFSNIALRVTRCNDVMCTSATSANVDTDIDTPGLDTSITIGGDGQPTISHRDGAFGYLWVTRLRNTAWTPNTWES